MDTTKATPRPWAIEPEGAWIMAPECEGAGDVICDMPAEGDESRAAWPANAALIVKAVNAFDAAVELRAAIGRLIPHLDVYPDDLAEAVTAFDAKAEGASP